MRRGIEVRLGTGDRERLEAVIGLGNSPQKHVWRSRIVLLSADGVGTMAIQVARSLGDQVIDVDVEVREGVEELAVDGFEAFRADEDGVGIRKAVGFALRVEEFVDGGFVALIPDFFKPASCEGLVLF